MPYAVPKQIRVPMFSIRSNMKVGVLCVPWHHDSRG